METQVQVNNGKGETVVSPEMEMFEKVSLMSNLTGAVQNTVLKDTILSLPSGEKIYNLLVKAVHQEIQQIMGKSDKDTKELSNNMQQMAAGMSKFVQVINTFNDSKLIGVLNAIAQKLKPLGDLGHPQEMVSNQQQYDQQYQQESGDTGPVYIAPGQRAPRNPGIGSF